MPKIHHDDETGTEDLQYKLIEHVEPAHDPIAILNLNGAFFTIGVYKGETNDVTYVRQDTGECVYLNQTDTMLLINSLVAAYNKCGEE